MKVFKAPGNNREYNIFHKGKWYLLDRKTGEIQQTMDYYLAFDLIEVKRKLGARLNSQLEKLRSG